MAEPARIGIIGDLHGHWDDWDARYFDASHYEVLLFTGDLGSGSSENGVRIARSVGRLAKPAFVMPGNNDARDTPRISAELLHQRGLTQLMQYADARKNGPRRGASGTVQLCGYSSHRLPLPGRAVTLITGRPHAMGGGELSFPERLAEAHDVRSMDDSTTRLRALVDSAETDDLIMLGHNGPTGLGSEAWDLWGCDFRPGGGDFGDPDLTTAVAHARARGHRVLAVIAGHMHSPTQQGRARRWLAAREGTLYLNPARVPRIFDAQGQTLRYHVALELHADRAVAREVLVPDPG